MRARYYGELLRHEELDEKRKNRVSMAEGADTVMGSATIGTINKWESFPALIDVRC